MSIVSAGTMITRRSIRFRSSRTLPRHAASCSAFSAAAVNFFGWKLCSSAEELREVLRQDGDVVAPLAQRRRADGDDVQAVVEVLAEAAGLDLLLEILVRRGDDADVDLDDGRRSDRLDFAFLQHAQHLRLRAQRHVADLVEEDRAAVGGDELAGLLAHGAGERSLLVAEQLRLDQLLGDRRAVDLHERLPSTREERRWISRATSSLPVPDSPVISTVAFVGAARSIMRLQLAHRRRVADELVDLLGLLAELADLFLELLRADGVADREQQLVAIERLLEEVERAALGALDGGRDVAVAGDHDRPAS